MIHRADQNMNIQADSLTHRAELSPDEVAEYWGLHVNTVYRDIKRGRLQSRRLDNGTHAIAEIDALKYGERVIPAWVPKPTEEQEWRRREISAAHERSAGKCALCGEPVDLTIQSGRLQPTLDHILPQSKGGGHERDNLQLAHRRCNSRKRDRIP